MLRMFRLHLNSAIAETIDAGFRLHHEVLYFI